MPAISVRAPAKSILVGEHAVVYNRPAIAFPINQLQAKTTITANVKGNPDEIEFHAPDINFHGKYITLPNDHPYKIAVSIIKKEAGIDHYPACNIQIQSTIPIASGMGSSAAIAVAIIKGLSQFIGLRLSKQRLADLAYLLELQYHGTPSGIDNTVIAFNQPIFFNKEKGFHIIFPKSDLTILIANSGIQGKTKEAVMGVKARWKIDQKKYETKFDQIGLLVENAEIAIKSGDAINLGKIMNENHQLLTEIGVSLPQLDTMVEIALTSGAFGAKLSGGGLGGNMIALASPNLLENIAENLRKAGIKQILFEKIYKVENE
ncbi:MAG: mevalonate kinase [Anaerolineaceae bacterium]|nr:mevalonate kinase [Anaerolineaceae bacterium]